MNVVSYGAYMLMRLAGSARFHLRRLEDAVRLRAYEGASHSKRLSGWNAGNASARAETEAGAPTLRARSRDLARNNPHGRRALNAVCSNTIGCGIVARVKDKKRAEVWKKWAESTTADFMNEHNFYGLQNLVMRTLVESGEVFVRRVVEKGQLRLQVLEPESIDEIETDDYGRPKAYRVFKRPGAEDFSPAVRIPAEDIIHLFQADRASQGRGVPWLAPVILELRDLGDYKDAELLRRKIAACFAGFVTFPRGTDAAQKKTWDLSRKIQPGTITEVPDGATLHMASPPQVSEGEFVRDRLRGVAAGVGLTYEVLTADYSTVNFSSGRMGWIEMQRMIDQWRWLLIIPRFCSRVFEWFFALQFADVPGVSWTPPRREMLDPVKEITAQQLAVQSGFTSISEVIRQNGDDPDEVFEELKSDVKKLGDVLAMLGRTQSLKEQDSHPKSA